RILVDRVVVVRGPRRAVANGDRGGGVEPGPGDRPARQRRDGVRGGEDLVDDLGVGPGGVQPLDQGRHAGDVGGGHGGATDGVVAAARPGAADVHARGADVHRGGPVVGEAGLLVVVVGGSQRADVGEVVAGGVEGGGVVVGAVVAGGGDEEVPGVAGGGELVEEGGRETPAAPAVAGDRDPVGHGVGDGRDGAGGR